MGVKWKPNVVLSSPKTSVYKCKVRKLTKLKIQQRLLNDYEGQV